jgi:hypothetical protein
MQKGIVNNRFFVDLNRIFADKNSIGVHRNLFEAYGASIREDKNRII